MAATARTKRISDDALAALRSIEFEGNVGYLRCGQLSPKVYKATNSALETLGGKWNRKAKGHLFEGDCRDQLEAMIETGEFTSPEDAKKLFQFFETPDDVADYVVGLLEYEGDADSILEPSAGTGQLVRAIRRHLKFNPWVSAVEIQADKAQQIGNAADALHVCDFLKLSMPLTEDVDPFGYVVMNPPFSRQQDIDHVMHAWEFLAPGGRLVSIMSPGWTFRENKKSGDFRDFVSRVGCWEKLPDGSFKESGTMVNSVVVVLDK